MRPNLVSFKKSGSKLLLICFLNAFYGTYHFVKYIIIIVIVFPYYYFISLKAGNPEYCETPFICY